MKITLLLILSTLLSPVLLAMDIISMRPIVYSGDPRESYKYQLVDLLLKTTQDKYGPYEIHLTKAVNSQKRDIKEINSGNINIFISMTSKAREEAMMAIPYPVFKGLYGYRVFLIKASEQAKFSKIKTIQQLKKLKAIQGTHWPDLNILKSNGFHVEDTSHHNSLYKMLEFGRVDYFPRGIHEPWSELKARPDMGLAVEKNLMLYYPAPGYIFVHKSNTHLAARFKEGFERIISSGEFDRFFNQHPQIVEMKQQANLKNRRLFKLSNPLLSKDTPIHDERLWFQINPNK